MLINDKHSRSPACSGNDAGTRQLYSAILCFSFLTVALTALKCIFDRVDNNQTPSIRWVPCSAICTLDTDGVPIERDCYTYQLEAIFEASAILIRFIVAFGLTVRIAPPRVPRGAVLSVTVLSACIFPCALLQYASNWWAGFYAVFLVIDQMVGFMILFLDQKFWLELPSKYHMWLSENGKRATRNSNAWVVHYEIIQRLACGLKHAVLCGILDSE